MDPKEILQEVQDTIKYGNSKQPNVQKAFMNFNQEVLGPGKLTTKTKELIALALSLSSTCEWCITFHVKMAKEQGATDEEILEASYVAVLMAGAPALMHMTIVRETLESL
jgi:AhpD family alkylhydroperoxidase